MQHVFSQPQKRARPAIRHVRSTSNPAHAPQSLDMGYMRIATPEAEGLPELSPTPAPRPWAQAGEPPASLQHHATPSALKPHALRRQRAQPHCRHSPTPRYPTGRAPSASARGALLRQPEVVTSFLAPLPPPRHARGPLRSPSRHICVRKPAHRFPCLAAPAGAAPAEALASCLARTTPCAAVLTSPHAGRPGRAWARPFVTPRAPRLAAAAVASTTCLAAPRPATPAGAHLQPQLAGRCCTAVASPTPATCAAPRSTAGTPSSAATFAAPRVLRAEQVACHRRGLPSQTEQGWLLLRHARTGARRAPA